MSRKSVLFLVPVFLIFILAFGGCGGSGDDGFVDGGNDSNVSVSGTPSMKKLVTASNDVSFYTTDNKVTSPIFSEFQVELNDLNKKSIGNADGTMSAMATGPGTSLNTAPQVAVSGMYQFTLDSVGAENWFFVQADRYGQMTVHLDVPGNQAIDYDLHVLRYDPSNSTVYAFINSTRGPNAAEHISFVTAKDAIYFICVRSYQGFSTTDPYVLHVEMANQTGGEVDDFPEGARTFPLNSTIGASGTLSMRNDEDFWKFTALGNKACVYLYTNGETVVDVFRQSGTSVTLIYQLAPGWYILEDGLWQGTTYYLRFRHANNKKFGLTSNYKVEVNSFGSPRPIASFLGRQRDGSRVAYITSPDDLYVNSTHVLSGLTQKCSYEYSEPDVTDIIQNHHTSHARAPVGAARFVSYTVFGGVVDSIYDALQLTISGDADFENRKRAYSPRLGGYDWNYQRGTTRYASYIVDLSDNKVKDFASVGGNGFYNTFLDDGYFVMSEK